MNGRQIINAICMVLGNPRYLIIFLLLIGAFIWLFLYIPVKNIPGNDFAFQLSIMAPKDFVLLITLSTLTALSVVMNGYILKRQFSVRSGVGLVGQGGLGGFAGVIGSIFGTASCASCAISLFGFLGVGSVLFLLQYRQAITMVAILLLIISLYFTSKSVLGICTVKRRNHD